MLLDHLTDIDSAAMASSNTFFASSPTVVLPQNEQHLIDQHQHLTDAPPAIQFHADPMAKGFDSNSLLQNDSALLPPLAGRKRSRGDVYAPEEDSHEDVSHMQTNNHMNDESVAPRGEAVYGPGMTLVYPDDPSYEARPESQSGTWVEERAEMNQFQLFSEPQQRPQAKARKSQRVDSSAASPDDLAQLILPPHMREVTTEPLISEATRTLGISWTRMDATEAKQINQAAYSKWIQNHYPSLKDVAIWFENSAIPCYLVEAQNAYTNQQEFYIFANDLTEARLVTNDPAQLLPRLAMLPALELAAPGGCIKAELESVVTANVEEMPPPPPPPAHAISEAPQTNGVKGHKGHAANVSISETDFMMHPAMLQGYFCSAHEMDMD